MKCSFTYVERIVFNVFINILVIFFHYKKMAQVDSNSLEAIKQSIFYDYSRL